MKRNILFSVFALLLGSCQSANNDAYERKTENSGELIISQSVEKLEGSDCVESKYIGIEGKPSEIYAAYDTLLKIASDSLWIKLSYDKSGVVRFYAFQALFAKKSPRVAEVISRLKNDTAFICSLGGDLKLYGTVGSFVRKTPGLDSLKKNNAVK